MMRAALRHPLPLTLGLSLLAGLLTLHNVLATIPLAALPRTLAGRTDMTDTPEVLAHYTVMPRIVVALMAGAALAAAGAMLQHTLRNPLAEPATLDISSGAHLALTAVTLFLPGSLASGPELVALAGAFLALAAVLGLSWRKRLSPVTVVLSGLIVSLYCGAVAAALTLFNHDLLIGLFLWGAGYLDQQDWSSARFLAPCLLGIAFALALCSRMLSLASLEDGIARSLGIPASA